MATELNAQHDPHSPWSFAGANAFAQGYVLSTTLSVRKNVGGISDDNTGFDIDTVCSNTVYEGGVLNDFLYLSFKI
jgi:hypothetical protein